LSSYNLAQYVWKNRVVLIFAPTLTDARLTGQQSILLQHHSELAERDIVVLPIVGSDGMRLRNQFRIGPLDFATILIGKDGNEKHRWTDVAPVDQINHRIDRMPMRKVEARARQIIRPVP
jgi:hypothetical protein